MGRLLHSLVVTVVLFLAVSTVVAAPPDDRGPDPTGAWSGPLGHLVLVRAGDTLSFSYTAVFGDTAHLCDGLGVAGFDGGGRWQFVDEQGTVTFTVTADRLVMAPTAGIASFCGANWPGESFARASWQPPQSCTVSADKAHFLVVGPLPPEPRRGYVVRGDRVEVLSLVNEGSPAWVLGRFVGPSRTTAGLLERDALDCPDD